MKKTVNKKRREERKTFILHSSSQKKMGNGKKNFSYFPIFSFPMCFLMFFSRLANIGWNFMRFFHFNDFQNNHGKLSRSLTFFYYPRCGFLVHFQRFSSIWTFLLKLHQPRLFMFYRTNYFCQKFSFLFPTITSRTNFSGCSTTSSPGVFKWKTLITVKNLDYKFSQSL